MSSIFERVLDAFKLNRFQPNFEHSFLISYINHPKYHQGHQPHSGMSISSSTPANTPNMSSIFERVLDAFKLNKFQPNFKHSFLITYVDHPKRDQGHQPHSGMSISSSTPATTLNMSSIFESVLNAFKLNRFQQNFKHSFFIIYADHQKRHQGHRPHWGMYISS